MIVKPTIERRLRKKRLKTKRIGEDLYAVVKALAGNSSVSILENVLVFVHEAALPSFYLILTRGSTTIYSRSDSRIPNTVSTAMNIFVAHHERDVGLHDRLIRHIADAVEREHAFR